MGGEGRRQDVEGTHFLFLNPSSPAMWTQTQHWGLGILSCREPKSLAGHEEPAARRPDLATAPSTPQLDTALASREANSLFPFCSPAPSPGDSSPAGEPDITGRQAGEGRPHRSWAEAC